MKIERSHVSNAPYKVKWAKRIACPEDPWISARDHDYKGMMREGLGGRCKKGEVGGKKRKERWKWQVEVGYGTRRVS